MVDYGTDALLNDEMIIAIVTVIIGVLLFLVFFINSYLTFKAERDYIKMEIKRSIKEKEYRYWRRELKMLYIGKIPIVRYMVRRNTTDNSEMIKDIN